METTINRTLKGVQMEGMFDASHDVSTQSSKFLSAPFIVQTK